MYPYLWPNWTQNAAVVQFSCYQRRPVSHCWHFTPVCTKHYVTLITGIITGFFLCWGNYRYHSTKYQHNVTVNTVWLDCHHKSDKKKRRKKQLMRVLIIYIHYLINADFCLSVNIQILRFLWFTADKPSRLTWLHEVREHVMWLSQHLNQDTSLRSLALQKKKKKSVSQISWEWVLKDFFSLFLFLLLKANLLNTYLELPSSFIACS